MTKISGAARRLWLAAKGRLQRRAQKKRLKMLIEHVPAIVYVAGFGTDARWDYVSSQIERVLGFSAQEWMADPRLWYRQLHPADRDWVMEEAEHSRIDRETMIVEYRIFGRDGGTVWIRDEATVATDGSGTPLCFCGALHDVTQRKDAEAASRASDRRFEAIFDSAGIGVDLVDIDGRILESNRKLQEMLGYTAEELRGMTVLDFTHPDDREATAQVLSALLEGRTNRCTTEKRYLRKDGSIVWGTLSATAPLADDGLPHSFIGIIEDITERKELEEQLRHLAFHDSLTGLANRALFGDRLEHALSRRNSEDEPMGLLLIDLDDFKTINDNHGHLAGDDVLVEVAQRLRNSLRPSDTVARLGGDEFAVLIHQAADEGDVERAAARIVELLAPVFTVRGEDVSIHASIGVAFSSSGDATSDDLMRKADAAMYAAKPEAGSDYRPAGRALIGWS
jgi:diguanylate cyclase (GGDEF)-like protein/PAS domain S-box-containing protein